MREKGFCWEYDQKWKFYWLFFKYIIRINFKWVVRENKKMEIRRTFYLLTNHEYHWYLVWNELSAYLHISINFPRLPGELSL